VIAPARTGKLNTSRMAVTKMAQVYRLIWFELSILIPMIVTIKFIAPNKLLRPLKCKLTIVLSTATEL
jgi:hypothetical protein